MNTDPIAQPKKPRRYRKITPEVIARFNAEQALLGNGSAAVRELEPDSAVAGSRAHLIAKKSEISSGAAVIDLRLDELAGVAIERVGAMVSSLDEKIATKNAHFVIDHVRGQAVKRSESRSVNINIESILS